MRKGFTYIAVIGALGWAAAPASAAPNLLAHWTFDEGIGQVAGDTSGQGNSGELGASGAPDGADPAWVQGHTGVLEPPHIGVEAWVRRVGPTPDRWRYVLSKGSVECDRSAYGLYTGFSGGMAFYVSSSSRYTISPEVSPAIVWDGEWHHVIGSYDGTRVRLWIDGSQVSDGTPATISIAYTSVSRGVYVGTYRGTCDLGFEGAIDDVSVWDDIPGVATTGPMIASVPGTPTQVPIPRAGGGASPPPPATTTKSHPLSCPRVSLSRRNIPVRHKTRLIATVRRDGLRVVGARIVVIGEGVTATGARTDRKGTTKIAIRARRAGTLKVKVRGERSSCPEPTVRAR
jgi:Concanavalin A-like lectin/glucanases superfamily